jgi:hypothetical protein
MDDVAPVMEVPQRQSVAEESQNEKDIDERRCLEKDLDTAHGVASTPDEPVMTSAVQFDLDHDDDTDDDDDDEDDDARRKAQRKPASDFRDIVKLIAAFKNGELDDVSLRAAGLPRRRVSKPVNRLDL